MLCFVHSFIYASSFRFSINMATVGKQETAKLKLNLEDSITQNLRSQRTLENSNKTMNKCNPPLVAAMIAGVLAGFLGAFSYVGSYLIEPVRSSCPHWSPSVVVYAQAGGLGVFGFLSIVIAPYIQRLPPRPFVAASLLLAGISYGTCGATVLACKTTGPWLQGLFLVAYSLNSAAAILALLPAYDCAMAWLPARTGLGAGLVSVGASVGSIPSTQFAIALERLYNRKAIDCGTLLFAYGLVTSAMTATILALLTHPWKNGIHVTAPGTKTTKIKWNVLKFKRMWILMLVRLLSLGPPLALESREQDLFTAFWRESNPPLELLSFTSQILNLVGTIFFAVVSDSLGPTRLWVVVTGIETIAIGFLPWFMSSVGSWSRYAALAAYGLHNMVMPASNTVIGAVSHEFFGLRLATEALGALHLPFAVAGLVGPVVMETMYQMSDKFVSFLYLSAGFFGSGLIMLALLHSCYRSPRETEREREAQRTN